MKAFARACASGKEPMALPKNEESGGAFMIFGYRVALSGSGVAAAIGKLFQRPMNGHERHESFLEF
jgi:hypothetical protein